MIRATMHVTLRLLRRVAGIEAQVSDINNYIGRGEVAVPPFPSWISEQITSTTGRIVAVLHDWERPVEIRDPAARMLQRALFGADHAPAEWWSTMTGADMVYAIGYTHAEVPLDLAPHVLMRTRPGVHWLRRNKDLQLTDRSFYNYVQGSAEWKAQARQLHAQAA